MLEGWKDRLPLVRNGLESRLGRVTDSLYQHRKIGIQPFVLMVGEGFCSIIKMETSLDI